MAVIAPSVVANNATSEPKWKSVSEEELFPLEFYPKSLPTKINTTEELNAVFTADDGWVGSYSQHELEALYRLQKSIED